MAQRIAHRTSNPGVAGSNPAGGVFFVVLEESSSQTKTKKHYAATGDRTWDLQIFSLTLSQLSYCGFWLLIDTAFAILNDSQTRPDHFSPAVSQCLPCAEDSTMQS